MGKKIQPELVFYHWSPVARRKSIERKGLMPGSLSLYQPVETKGYAPPKGYRWRPPYICFSDEPWLAWVLSGKFQTHIEEWDLWMAYAFDTNGFEMIPENRRDNGQTYIKEYRVYHRIPKSKLIRLGSRNRNEKW